jgi:hypothetical protein
VVVFAMVTGVLAQDTSLSAAVIRANADRLLHKQPPASTNTASLCDARSKLNGDILIHAARQMAESLDQRTKAPDFWNGFVPYAIDGTTLTAMDTEPNQMAYPQHENQSEGAGFPILRAVLLQNLVTGAVHDAAYGPFKGKETGEMALARQTLPSLPEQTLLIGDRYYPSYFLMAELVRRNIQGLFQMHASRDVDFRRGKKLGHCDHLATWVRPHRPDWMSPDDYDRYPHKITLRETDLSKEVGSKEAFVVVTTLTDEQIFSKGKLAKMYKKRWKIEVAFKDLKDTFGLEHIEAKTPSMISKIFWSYILAYNSLRWHMLNAAMLYDREVDKISVQTATRVIIENRLLILASCKKERPAIFAALYEQMIRVSVGNRPGRKEPRAVKRRPKPFPRLNSKRSSYQQRISA